jgi:hypothetical protein
MSYSSDAIRLCSRLVRAYEEGSGRTTVSIETSNMRGFTGVRELVSRFESSKSQPEKLSADWLSYVPGKPEPVRIIEAKSKQTRTTDIPFLKRQMESAKFFGHLYWLYALVDCATQPRMYVIQDPARLNWWYSDLPSDPFARPGSPGSEPRYWLSVDDAVEAGELVDVEDPGERKLPKRILCAEHEGVEVTLDNINQWLACTECRYEREPLTTK